MKPKEIAKCALMVLGIAGLCLAASEGENIAVNVIGITLMGVSFATFNRLSRDA